MKQHPSQRSSRQPSSRSSKQARPKARRSRVKFAPPPEETPFSPRRFSWHRLRLVDAVYLVIAVVATSTLLGMCHTSLRNYFAVNTRLAKSTAQLQQLQEREASLSQRLAYLNSPEGRDQLLRERGFVRGNERILLFEEDAPASQSEKPADRDEQKKFSFLSGVVSALDSAADRPAVRR